MTGKRKARRTKLGKSLEKALKEALEMPKHQRVGPWHLCAADYSDMSVVQLRRMISWLIRLEAWRSVADSRSKGGKG